jgi:hypothetical protein
MNYALCPFFLSDYSLFNTVKESKAADIKAAASFVGKPTNPRWRQRFICLLRGRGKQFSSSYHPACLNMFMM